MLRYAKGPAVWTIAQAASTITTSLDGLETVELFASDAIARTRFDILIKRQSRDGWTRIKDEAAKPRQQGTSPAIVVEDARNLDLEAAITTDPDNPEGYRVYADWLEQQGDPRGRLIGMMLALEASPDHKLQLLIDAYRYRLHAYLSKGVIDRDGCQVHVARGFIDRIEYVQDELAPLLRQTLAAPAARFVKSIRLDDDGTGRLAEALRVVAEAAPATLQEVTIGGRSSLDDLDPIAALLPRLRKFSVFNVDERQLRLGSRAIEQIVTSPFPHLTDLHLDLQSSIPVSDLARLFARNDLQKVETLGFRTGNDGTVLRMLADSPLAGQITNLTLEHFGLEDVALFREIRPALTKLVELDIGEPEMWDTDARDAYEAEGLTIDYPSGNRRPRLRGQRDADDDDAFDDVRE